MVVLNIQFRPPSTPKETPRVLTSCTSAMAGSAITAAAASRTFFIQYLLVEEFQRGASRRADQMRKQATSTRRLLHSPPNGACFDALLPKCGPDVTVPQPEP